MNVFRCYTSDELSDYILGKLASEKSNEITHHLDQCGVCEDTIVGLEKTSDTFVDLLSKKPLPAETDSPVYQDNPDYDRAAIASQQVINSWQLRHEIDAPQLAIETIGEYQIVETLARGSMGSVFRARHMRLEKEVAIKILPERKMQSPDAIARFSREMKIIGQMSHPSMVAATDAGAAKGIHYLVMELVHGVDLGKIVRRCGPLSIGDACELIRQSAIGIQYAHDQGVIHRDVKPSNLMLARDSSVKVLDLGLATLGGLTGTVDELTTVGQLMGTLDYMAPEQCGNSHAVDHRSDVYGLGATLYKLIAGVAPYSSPENDTPLKKLRSMATCDPVPITERVEDLPSELIAVVDRALADDPNARFGSAAEMAVALEPFCRENNLGSLLKRAESHEQKNEPTVQVEMPVVRNSKRSDLKRHPQPPFKKSPAPLSGTRGNWFGRVALLLVGFGLAIWGGIVIYLNTTAGQLIIESEIDSIQVTVLKDASPTKDLQIEHGKGSTRLRAGQYQVMITGESDELIIENDKFVLKKCETVVARITRRKSKTTQVEQKPDLANAVSSRTDQLRAQQMQDRRKEQTLAYENRLYELKKERARFLSNDPKDEIGEQHPGIILFDELIAETKRTLELPPVEEDTFEDQLFELRKDRAYSLLSSGTRAVEMVDAQIAAHKEFMNERAEARAVRETNKGDPAESVSYSESQFAGKLPSAVESGADLGASIGLDPEPTYQGSGLEHWINQTINTGDRITRNEFLSVVGKLATRTSQEQKQKLVEKFLDKYRLEVSDGIQIGLAATLSLICDTPTSFDKVFDHVSDRISPESLEHSLPKRFQEKMIGLLKLGDRKKVTMAVQWASQRVHDRQQNMESTMNDSANDSYPKLNPQWSQALIKKIGDESLKYDICEILMDAFSNDPKVVLAISKAVENDKELYLTANCIDFLLDAKPEDTKLAETAVLLLNKQIIPTDRFVYESLRLAAHKDNRLLNQLEIILRDENWGIMTKQEMLAKKMASQVASGSTEGSGNPNRSRGKTNLSGRGSFGGMMSGGGGRGGPGLGGGTGGPGGMDGGGGFGGEMDSFEDGDNEGGSGSGKHQKINPFYQRAELVRHIGEAAEYDFALAEQAKQLLPAIEAMLEIDIERSKNDPVINAEEYIHDLFRKTESTIYAVKLANGMIKRRRVKQ